DPLSPTILADASWVYYGARRYDRALQVAREWVELAPSSPWAHTYLGLALQKTGKIDEGIRELERAARMDRSVTILEWLGGAVPSESIGRLQIIGWGANRRPVSSRNSTRRTPPCVTAFESSAKQSAKR